ncbi:squalene/phytoene synthase family protein [Jannaschia sp. Os4]|uniref:squalene/phytoene synthase family protein n=1 Tax=Jannaschia sp. Os4 TaxID=2807617 RepID=UPI001939CFDB|nr:squalene/phytoene synthase family protein [Jannaschia sp. Os4]MBM2575889.1 squalene/phytoene synthase family protein [Jannaschia sp. Os4]
MIVPPTTATADAEEVRRVVAAAGSSFAAGMRVLPRARRRAIHAVYALCRVVDDIADGDAPGSDTAQGRKAGLDRWADEIDAAFRGAPRSAIGAEVARSAEAFDLPRGEFDLVIDGMRMDAVPIVAPSDAELHAYVRRVAGAVGILSMRCFGAWIGAPSERFALSLARGLQLTNILRDVEEDAGRGRLYLPAPALTAVGIPHCATDAPAHPSLPAARALVGAQARAAFDEAAALVPVHRRLPLLPALLMMGPYERMLATMERDWSAPPPRPSTVAKLRHGLARAAKG